LVIILSLISRPGFVCPEEPGISQSGEKVCFFPLFADVHSRILSYSNKIFLEQNNQIFLETGFVFPIKNYSERFLFNCNETLGLPETRPGFQICIIDKNKDSLDDRTGEPVFALAFDSGIVIDAFSSSQKHSSKYGNYL